MFRILLIFSVLLVGFSGLQAQTDKRDIDEKFFEFDTYPFELAESSGKWGLKFKEVYERKLAITYLKRNYHYNNRVDTLVNNTWLILPYYDKFERWSYGPRFQFIAGTRKDKIDFFTLSGEILGRNVTEFLSEKVNLEKSDIVMTLKTGNQWKWFYEGDFYNKNTTIYYSSPLFDKMEIKRDTVVQNFHFVTEVQGVQQLYNLVGHELSGNLLAVETKKPIKEEVKPQVLAVVEKKQEAENRPVVKVVEQVAVKETQVSTSVLSETAALKKQLEEEQKARAAAEQKATEQSKRAEQAEQAKAAAELKSKNEEQEKLAAQKALREALEKANATNEQLTSAEAEHKAKKDAEVKAAVEKALKEDERQAKLAIEAAAEAGKTKQEAELAKANPEQERKEEVAAELKVKQEAEAKAIAEKQTKEEAEAIKLAVEKALKEAELKAQQEAAAQKKAMEDELIRAKAEAEKQMKIEAEQKIKEDAQLKAIQELEQKAKAEAEKNAKEEAIKIAVEKALKEAELKAEQEAAAEKKAKEVDLIRAKAEAEQKAKAEEQLKAKQELEQKAKAEKNAREEAIKLAVEKALKEAELKAQQEAAAQKKAMEDELIRAKAEAEKQLKTEAEQKAKDEAIKFAVEKALKEAQEKERLAAQQKADEELASAEKQNQATLKKAVAENFGEIIQDRNIIMQKILARDKMLTYEFYKENNFYGLKNAEGKVLIYPAMKNINIVYPSNPELKYSNINAAIEFELDGMSFRIINPEFAGPENLGNHTIKCTTCSSGFKSIDVKWSSAKKKYEY